MGAVTHAKTDLALDELIASPEFGLSPYDILDRMRDERPVYWSQAWRCWFVTTYDLAADVLRDEAHFTNVGRPGFDLELAHGEQPVTPRTLLSADPPLHTRLRWATIGGFTPQAIGALRSRILDFVEQKLDGVTPGRPVDVVTELAAPIAVHALAFALGMPLSDLPARMGEDQTLFTDDLGIPRASPFGSTYGARLQAQREAAGMTPDTTVPDYVAARIDDPHAFEPGSPLNMIQRARDAGEMTPDEAMAYAVMLIGAGTETTRILITTALGLLLAHPEELKRLREHDAWRASAVEEALRYEPPAQRIPRRAKVDFELGGNAVKAGEIVMVMLTAANRDPSKFADPHRFLVDRFFRERTAHLTLSLGRHGCLGAHLARLEADVFLEATLRRFSDIRLVDTDLPWLPRYEFRYLGPRLMVEFR